MRCSCWTKWNSKGADGHPLQLEASLLTLNRGYWADLHRPQRNREEYVNQAPVSNSPMIRHDHSSTKSPFKPSDSEIPRNVGLRVFKLSLLLSTYDYILNDSEKRRHFPAFMSHIKLPFNDSTISNSWHYTGDEFCLAHTQ